MSTTTATRNGARERCGRCGNSDDTIESRSTCSPGAAEYECDRKPAPLCSVSRARW